jgi:hypothetical protein
MDTMLLKVSKWIDVYEPELRGVLMCVLSAVFVFTVGQWNHPLRTDGNVESLDMVIAQITRSSSSTVHVQFKNMSEVELVKFCARYDNTSFSCFNTAQQTNICVHTKADDQVQVIFESERLLFELLNQGISIDDDENQTYSLKLSEKEDLVNLSSTVDRIANVCQCEAKFYQLIFKVTNPSAPELDTSPHLQDSSKNFFRKWRFVGPTTFSVLLSFVIVVLNSRCINPQCCRPRVVHKPPEYFVSGYAEMH